MNLQEKLGNCESNFPKFEVFNGMVNQPINKMSRLCNQIRSTVEFEN